MARLHIPEWIIIAHARGHRVHSRPVTASVRQSRRAAATLVIPTTPPNTLNTPPKPPSTPSASLPKAITPKTPPRTPRHQLSLKPRVPLRNQPAFDAAHLHDARRLAEYRHMDRKGSVRLPWTAIDEIDPRSAARLPANNYTARINYARIATAHVGRFAETLPRSAPAYFVTLIVDRYTVGLREAGEFNPKRLQAWARQMLPGCSFLGMVEAALYTNVGVVWAGMDRAVSWHVHLILWGTSESWLADRCDAINARYRTLLPGVTAAHYRRLARHELVEQTFYMVKAPISDHRIWAMKEEHFDSQTGKVTVRTNGHFNQGKRELRPCDLTRMIMVMSGKTINRLAFAAGAGKALLTAINDEALAPHRASEQVERSREARLRRKCRAWERAKPRRRR